ncbi:MBL fold metallo-hydrolase [Shimazuella soli]|uniref:MBL fold metallo-hydrolase n=1 Tax=Shimazuella soli TaxID=1892854 RepID=UPI001F10467B|nr:MBL fold metallo-hydrolase [Shimazuella soli]
MYNIFAVSLPLPFSLKQITAYVVEVGDKLTIIDTGLHTKQTSDTWQRFFHEKGWQWKQVEKIIVTHYHPDHYGFAGKLQEWSGASVYISKREYDQIQAFWNPTSGNPSEVATFFASYGFPSDRLHEITEHMEGFRAVIEPHPSVLKWLDEDERLAIGGESYQVIHTPGHSPGHLSFLHSSGTFFGGDVVLPSVTPNIPLMPYSDPNPLATFLSTLDKIKSLDIEMVYPAHGDVFYSVEQRIKEIKDHHGRRLEKIKAMVQGNSAQTGFQICEQLFSNRKLDIHNLRFAFSETLAHLEYLRLRGEIKRQFHEHGYQYFV